jgi:hypothetical protein
VICIPSDEVYAVVVGPMVGLTVYGRSASQKVRWDPEELSFPKTFQAPRWRMPLKVFEMRS